MKILVVGSGGREHALAWKISQSPHVEKLYCAPGNAGTINLGENVPLPDSDIRRLADFAAEKKVDLTLVGYIDCQCYATSSQPLHLIP